jgi:hypothetical protein
MNTAKMLSNLRKSIDNNMEQANWHGQAGNAEWNVRALRSYEARISRQLKAVAYLEERLIREIERADSAAEAKAQSFTSVMLASLIAKHDIVSGNVAVTLAFGQTEAADLYQARALRLTSAISYLEERLERNESK